LDHADHVDLLRGAVEPGGTWADIGAGTGAFTHALADLLGRDGRIIAVDRDARVLRDNAAVMAAKFPGVTLDTVAADFTRPLDLPELDGIVAANSLHFVPREGQVAVVRSLASHVRYGGRFVVVEYDSDEGNAYVPHPFSVTTWERMAAAAGLRDTRQLGRVPSRFLGAIYAAESRRTEPRAPGDRPGR
jgi:SAM-dependent methyltransferase